MPMPGDAVFEDVERLARNLVAMNEILRDRARTSIRLVMNPERMVIAEARRTFTYLSLFGYRVDAVIANRLLPDEAGGEWFERWKQLQHEHLVTIDESFSPLPVLRAELAREELVGMDRLRTFAGELYGVIDPLEVMHRGEPLRVEVNDGTYELVQELPFADRDDLEVGRRDDELLVRIGPYRRAVMLPDSLRRRPVEGAALRDGMLRITFGPMRTGGTPSNAMRQDDA
jgi:arsenite-transporting ATPase